MPRRFFVDIEPDSDRGQIVGEYRGIDIDQYQTIEAIAAADDLDPDDLGRLYYKNGEVRVKPELPTPGRFYWDIDAEDYREILDVSGIPRSANYSGLNADLSPNGKLGHLLIKAMNTKASPMLQGMLPTAIAFGNLDALKTCLEAIVGQMPADSRFTVEEMTALANSFKANNIPAKIVVKEKLLTAAVSIQVIPT
jgi:hypothetical protein